ncbi:MAG: XRE family transcriptional regulator [Deltaproteobacteria bacterium]|nr:MAG: XRE family transcriptional regulator [Deltaproteobacteria bacterium]
MESARIGERLRQLRLERGLAQADVARRLGISPAYLSLLEKGRRTMQFPLLLRALDLFGVGLDSFMADVGADRPDDVLASLLDDPLAQTLDLDEADLERLRAEPKAATTIAALFNLYKNTRAQLDTAMTKLEAGMPPRLDYAPGDEVTDFLERHRNYFPEIEEAADAVRRDANLPRRFIADALAAVLRARFDVDVVIDTPQPGSSVVRRFDRRTRRLVVSPDLNEHALKFQLAHVIGLLWLDDTGLDRRLVGAAPTRHAETARLIKIHLANYFAGALLLPYGPFFDAVQRTRYDVARLAGTFAASYEAVAHRMCNLADPRRAGVPLHFLRVDVAGNISKRYSATGLRFPQAHGTCPKWAVNHAFLTPAVIARQYSRMPDGQTYFCFAKVISEPRRGSLVLGTTYSIGLGARADAAHHFVYSDALPAAAVDRAAVPTGITCRFCERTDCNQRAAPSYKFAFAVDEYTKKDNFFSPLTGKTHGGDERE